MKLLISKTQIDTALASNDDASILDLKYHYTPQGIASLKRIMLGEATCNDFIFHENDDDDVTGKVITLTYKVILSVINTLVKSISPVGTIEDVTGSPKGVVVTVSFSERPASY